MIEIVLCALSALVVSALGVVAVIALQHKLKVGQPILSYVDNHTSKAGTPTFGGVAFVLSTLVCTLIFARPFNSAATMCAIVTAAYAVVGFMDDFIKAKSKQNQGLSALQKIIFQLFISVIISTFAYTNEQVSDKIIIPFSLHSVHLGFFAIPFYVFVFLAFTNAVNLTDGLDGLAAKTSVVYLIATTVIIILVKFKQNDDNYGLIIFSVALIFSLLGFLFFNSFPAKIFMGDTGSLALGGGIGALAVFSGMALYAPIVGVVYVFTCVSDVLQVAHYKRTKKRIFLMAPFHHHLERKGWHENSIVTLYSFVTLVFGLICVAITLFAL